MLKSSVGRWFKQSFATYDGMQSEVCRTKEVIKRINRRDLRRIKDTIVRCRLHLRWDRLEQFNRDIPMFQCSDVRRRFQRGGTMYQARLLERLQGKDGY